MKLKGLNFCSFDPFENIKYFRPCSIMNPGFLGSLSSPNFQDDYSSSAPWTQEGTLVTVNSGSFPNIGHFAAPPCDATWRGVHRDTGLSLSDTKWTLRIKFVYSGSGSSGTLGRVALLSSAITNPEGNGNWVGMTYNSAGGGIEIQYAVAGSVTAGSIYINVPLGTYYLQMERQSATLMEIKIFSDSGYTTQIAGSPINTTISSSVTGLKYLHHSNITGIGSGYYISGDVDDVAIWNGKNL